MRNAPTDSPARLRDVADAAGVNPSIASRILNNDPTLSARPETRSRVKDAARRLDYTPNAFARGLKLRRTSTLGLVLPNVGAADSAQLLQSADRRAAHHGHVVLLADMDDFAHGGDVYRRIILERRVDGLVISSAEADEGLIDDLNKHRIPFVVLNRRSAVGAVCVAVDDAAGTALAVDHLVGLRHTHIGHIASPHGSDAVARGIEGYRAAMRYHGLDGPDTVVQAEVTEKGGFRATAALLAAVLPPTALVVASVTQSVGAMAAVRAAGLSIPDDISLVTFEDALLTEYLDPPLTAVRMPLRELVETAIDQIIKLIAREKTRDIVISTRPELIIRNSTAALPKAT